MSADRTDRNGIVILYKDSGWTSFDAVAKARGILATRKVGHSGTLDPMATGVLPIFLGRATKAINMQIIKDKEYIAVFALGKNTDTGDITGEIIKERPVAVGKEDVLRQLEKFKGDIIQCPPMYSAVKVNGQPLYKLARQGITVERKPRTVIIKEIELLNDEALADNMYKIRVLCSEGTYIRTLVEDIGENLGCGAVLTYLCRTKACGYTLDEAVSIEGLQRARNDGTIDYLVRETDTLFKHLERLNLSRQLAQRLLNGAGSRISKADGIYRAYYKDKFYAVVSVKDKKMELVKLFVEKEKEEI